MIHDFLIFDYNRVNEYTNNFMQYLFENQVQSIENKKISRVYSHSLIGSGCLQDYKDSFRNYGIDVQEKRLHYV